MSCRIPSVAGLLRPYQAEAVAAVAEGLADGGTGQLHAACGSGKTVMGREAAVRLLPAGGLVAVLAPSLALVGQTIQAWREGAGGLPVLAVCSDPTVHETPDEDEGDVPVRRDDLAAPVTTDPEEVSGWLRRYRHGHRLIVGTYASADRLSAALRESGVRLDLLLLDEAHHLTGRPEAATRKAVEPDFLPARRRLFMTATPRVDAAAAMNYGHLSMDDTDIFGPVLYDYPFGRGIAERYLSDYRLYVVGIREREARALLADPRREYVDGPGQPSLQTLVAQTALLRAAQHHGVKRAVTFHHRVAEAAEFARSLPAAARRAGGVPVPHTAHVHGQMDHALREKVLDDLRKPPPGGWTVVSNARCLGEGVDVPAIDAVLFAHPKTSGVDIVQAVGRALRPHPDAPGDSVVIVPIVVPEEEGEIGDLDAGAYNTLWRIVRALRAHDEPLGIALDTTRSHLPAADPQLPGKITVELPPGVSDRLLEQLRLMMVRQVTSPWWEGYGHARAYREQYGDLDVPDGYVTEDGYRLGMWVQNARQQYRKGWMPADRITALNRLGMIWDRKEYLFEQTVERLRAYRDEYGDLAVPQSYRDADGCLGHRVNTLRRQYAKGRLAAERVAVLEELGMIWNTRDGQGNWQLLQHARAFHAAHGNLRVPPGHVTEDGYRLASQLRRCRAQYAKGDLPAPVAAALDALGIAWSPQNARFQAGLDACRRYRDRHGDLAVPVTHIDPEGYNLGDFIAYCRALDAGSIRDRNGRTRTLLPERRAALNELGMIWTRTVTTRPPTDAEIAALHALPRQRGKVPAHAILALVDQGVAKADLARALDTTPSSLNSRLRTARQNPPPDPFSPRLSEARAFRERHGHLQPDEYSSDPREKSLARWLRRQRRDRRRGRLTDEQIAALDELGIDWAPGTSHWLQSLAAARAFWEQHGHLRPPAGTVINGINLNVWLTKQRTDRRDGTLAPERAAALDELGIDWEPGAGVADVRVSQVWKGRLADARAYRAEHGHLRPPPGTRVGGRRLDVWLAVQRTRRRAGRLTDEQIAALDELGIDWEPGAGARGVRAGKEWENRLADARAYRAEHGHLRPPPGTRVGGRRLDAWLTKQRVRRREGRLTPQQIAALDELGIRW